MIVHNMVHCLARHSVYLIDSSFTSQREFTTGHDHTTEVCDIARIPESLSKYMYAKNCVIYVLTIIHTALRCYRCMKYM